MQQQIIEWRRSKVMGLLSKAESNKSEMARILQVDKSFICSDIAHFRQQAKENSRKEEFAISQGKPFWVCDCKQQHKQEDIR